jgi:hypothetical protein
MKSLNQLAQSAYAAYSKKAMQSDEEGLAGHAQTWDELDTGTRECWIAVAQQLWAEFSALR